MRSTSSNETELVGEQLGQKLKGGEVIELISDLGGGKTTFVRGLSRGFGSNDKVASPSFTISKVYKAGNKELHHFDFYRLGHAGIMAHELKEILDDKNTVAVIEWADIVQNVLPPERLTIRITTIDESTRDINFEVPSSLKYLIEELK